MTKHNDLLRPTDRASKMARYARRRKGVLLLVVLSLLVLFVLAGLSFIVVASQYRKASLPGKKTDRTEGPSAETTTSIALARATLGSTISQLLAPPTSGTYLSGHGMIEDLYGQDMFPLRVSDQTATVDDFDVDASGELLIIEYRYPVADAFPPPPTGYYAGSVLTMTSGELKNLSTRVIDYDWRQGGPSLAIVTVVVRGFGDEEPEVGDTFFINGRPFNGTGAGFVPGNDGLADTLLVNGQLEPTALLPGHPDYASSLELVTHLAGTAEGLPANGSDESYDAPDYQNFWLGWMSASADGGEDIIPSFHRPGLISYWGSQFDLLDPTNVELLRAIMPRPNPIDHPEFSGSNLWLDPKNPRYSPTEKLSFLIAGTINEGNNEVSTWDVDNDADGLADSVWIDTGIPVATSADGTQYKPLMAILCVDMDGRINLNTAGILDFAAAAMSSNLGNEDARAAGRDFDDGQISSYGPHAFGGGYGPAEITLLPIAGDNQTASDLIRARYRSFVDGDELPGFSGDNDEELFVPRRWHAGMYDNPATAPNWHHTLFFHGLPSDFMSRQAVVVDHIGQPVVANRPNTSPSFGEIVDDPYEVNVVAPNGRDWLYTYGDLESLLRPNDVDSFALPSRLIGFESSTGATPFEASELLERKRRRRSVTVASFDIPVSKSTISFSELLSQQIEDYQDRFRSPPGTITQNAKRDLIHQLIPYEMRYGGRLNLLRYFGDGVDNNGNRIVDEPDLMDEERDPLDAANSARSDALRTLLLNDDPVFLRGWPESEPGIQPVEPRTPPILDPNVGRTARAPVRQMFARHLYTLMLAIYQSSAAPPDGTGPTDPANPIRAIERNKTAQQTLAQWAVNVVDFCDSDSIMTPFEFDPSPFKYNPDPLVPDGWTQDGDLRITPDPDHTVWGVERPELLITETLAWHDRRVEDTVVEDVFVQRDYTAADTGTIVPTRERQAVDPTTLNPEPMAGGYNAADPRLEDLDQRGLPQGSLFVELYAPWASQYTSQIGTATGGEFYQDGALRLDRLSGTTPAGTGVSPVWRLHVTSFDPITSELAPADQQAIREQGDPSDYPSVSADGIRESRYVYFVADQTVLPNHSTDDEIYFINSTDYPDLSNGLRLQPGGYAVVGSGAAYPNRPGDFVSTVGFSKNFDFDSGGPSEMDYQDARGVVFRTAPDNGELQVAVANNGTDESAGVKPQLDNTDYALQNLAVVTNRVRYNGAVSNNARLNVSVPLGGYAIDVDAFTAGLQDPTFSDQDERVMQNAVLDMPLDMALHDEPVVYLKVDSNDNVVDDGSGNPVQWSYPENDLSGTPVRYHMWIDRFQASPPIYTEDPNEPGTFGKLSQGGQLVDLGGETGRFKPDFVNPRLKTIFHDQDSRLDAPDERPLNDAGQANTLADNFIGQMEGEIRNFRIVHLQRLANPLLPWNPNFGQPGHNPNVPINPYRTIDSALIDLMVFNGLDLGAARNDFINQQAKSYAKQRGDQFAGVTAERPVRLLWSQEPTTPEENSPYRTTGASGGIGASSSHIFNHPFRTTLGHLNVAYQPAFHRLGVNNDRHVAPLDEYIGSPATRIRFGVAAVPGLAQTFPWLPWNNGPVQNVMELLDVPRTSSFELLGEYNPVSTQGAANVDQGRFGYTLNFFGNRRSVSSTEDIEFYRLFDFVEVPSPYLGTSTWFDVATYNGDSDGFYNRTFVGLQRPFNRVSNFREPGRVNLNTISDPKVLQALWHSAGLDANEIENGYNNLFEPNLRVGNNLALPRPNGFGSSQSPAVFNNPFRTPGSARFVPNLANGFDNLTSDPVGGSPLRIQGWFDPDPSDPDPGHRDRSRSPRFRHQMLQKMSSMTTTTSNVFAVWMTLGYFEATPDENVPGGYRFGKEVGVDTGTSQRHRAFYIIDRSIPVGYEPGKEHNADKAIVLQRFIE